MDIRVGDRVKLRKGAGSFSGKHGTVISIGNWVSVQLDSNFKIIHLSFSVLEQEEKWDGAPDPPEGEW